MFRSHHGARANAKAIRKGTKRGRGGPRSASDLDKEMDLYHGKPAKKGKPTAEDLDAEMARVPRGNQSRCGSGDNVASMAWGA